MFLLMDFDLELIAVVFILLFSSIFFIAWNSHFPTYFEQMAWRAASIYMMTFGLIGPAWMALWMWILLPEKRLANGHEMSLLEQSPPPHPGQLVIRRFLHWGQAPIRGPRLPHTEDASAEDTILHPPTSSGFFNKVHRILSKTHNISPDKDPYLDIPMGFLIGTSFLCLLYVVFRMYILTEDFVGLRSMPSNAYDTVDWLSFIPHV